MPLTPSDLYRIESLLLLALERIRLLRDEPVEAETRLREERLRAYLCTALALVTPREGG